jgi:hypothetical protein
VPLHVASQKSCQSYSYHCRREVLDGFLRDRAKDNGAKVVNGLVLRMDVPKDDESPYIIHYTDYAEVSSAVIGIFRLRCDALPFVVQRVYIRNQVKCYGADKGKATVGI